MRNWKAINIKLGVETMFRLLRTLFLIATLVFTLGASMPSNAQVAASNSLNDLAAWQAKVAPQVLAQSASGPTEFLVVLKAQADLSAAYKLPTKAEKGAYVYHQLSQLAVRAQKPVLAELKALGVSYHPFWVSNMIWVRGNAASVQAMAQRADVARLDANPWVKQELPQPVQAPGLQGPQAASSVEESINQVSAPQMWADGFNGQGVVIGGQDTGYQWNHEALKDHYRGWNANTNTANHNYNWHDAIHPPDSYSYNICGYDTPEPCDDFGHGTHTMGTMVGEDTNENNKIGMAPGARWIGCRNMDQGKGSPASYSECFQWFIAPTNLNDQNADPSKAPDVINNSWSCTVGEGCTWDTLQSVVNNTRAAGILVVASAGNSGSGCNTINNPPAMYGSAFTVGATDNIDNIAPFSSRGPGSGTNLLKPDVTAPGVSVLSSTKTGGYGYLSGTSMAAPHVTGLVALMLSADPLLRGNVDAIENIIHQSSVPLTTTAQDCGGVSGSQVPNNTFGYGRIDAEKALTLLPNLLTLQNTAPASVPPGGPITYTLTVTHKDPYLWTTNVVITDVVPSQTFFLSATGPYLRTGDVINWTFPQLGPNESQSVQIVVKSPYAEATIVNDQFQAKSDQFTGPRGGSVTTNVATVYSLALAPDYYRYATIGSTTIYTHDLTNTGNVADTYTMELSSSRGWARLSGPTIVNVPSGQSVPIQIIIDVPPDTTFGQKEFSMLKVSSMTRPDVFASITDTTSVASQILMLPLLIH
jgi:serine protease AprX